MKTVAVALVLIAGAAVVLWYGTTSNSLVLGGLIGGLAALLLSIPISLTLFAYLARRHDERLRAELQEYEELSLIQLHGQRNKPAYVINSEDEEDQEGMIFAEEADWQEEIVFHQNAPQRYLPAPGETRSAQSSRKLTADTRSIYTTPQSASTKKLPVHGKNQSSQRPTTQRALSTGLPGYQTSTFRSQYQSEALRIARKEAAHQNDEDREDISSTQKHPRRMSSTRPVRQPFEQEEYFEQDVYPRPDRQGPRSPTASYQQQPRRNRDGSISPNPSRRPFAPEDERTVRQGRRSNEPRTDQLDPDMLSNEMNKPLQRRAPYMYEDDELREQLSQRIDAPITRRSSRKLVRRPDQE